VGVSAWHARDWRSLPFQGQRSPWLLTATPIGVEASGEGRVACVMVPGATSPWLLTVAPFRGQIQNSATPKRACQAGLETSTPRRAVSAQLNKSNLPFAIEQVKPRPETPPRAGPLFRRGARPPTPAASQHARLGPTTPKSIVPRWLRSVRPKRARISGDLSRSNCAKRLSATCRVRSLNQS